MSCCVSRTGEVSHSKGARLPDSESQRRHTSAVQHRAAIVGRIRWIPGYNTDNVTPDIYTFLSDTSTTATVDHAPRE